MTLAEMSQRCLSLVLLPSKGTGRFLAPIGFFAVAILAFAFGSPGSSRGARSVRIRVPLALSVFLGLVFSLFPGPEKCTSPRPPPVLDDVPFFRSRDKGKNQPRGMDSDGDATQPTETLLQLAKSTWKLTVAFYNVGITLTEVGAKNWRKKELLLKADICKAKCGLLEP